MSSVACIFGFFVPWTALFLPPFSFRFFFVGIVGALIVLQNTSLDPNSAFSITWAINMVIMTILGGIATTTGPLIGAVLIFALQQALQSYSSLSTLLTGLLLIVMIRLAPQGIWVLFRKGIKYILMKIGS